MESLYQQHRGDWQYDFAEYAKGIADRYDGVSKDDLTAQYKSLQGKYDYDDAAYHRAFRYKNLTDPTQIAQAAGVSDAALKQTERGVYTPTQAAKERAVIRGQEVREERARFQAELAAKRKEKYKDVGAGVTEAGAAAMWYALPMNPTIGEYTGRTSSGHDPSMNSVAADAYKEAQRRANIVSGYEDAAKDKNNSWLERVLSNQAAQFGRLTGKDSVAKQVKAVGTENTPGKNQLAADVVNGFLSSVKGVADVAAGYANAAGHIIREADALYRKIAYNDDSEIKAGEFQQRYPVTGWIVDALLEAGDAVETLEDKTSVYLKATTGRTEASKAGQFVGDLAQTVTNSAARMLASTLAGSEAAATAMYMVESAGNTYDEMLDAGYTKMDAAQLAAWNACTEAVIERYSDRILLSGGKSLEPLAKSLLGQGRLSKLVEAGSKVASTRWGAAALRIFVAGGLNEGLEEYIEYYTGQLGERLALGQPINPTNSKDALRNAAMGTLCGTLLSGLGCGVDSIQQRAVQMGDGIVRDGNLPTPEQVIDLASSVAETAAAQPVTMDELRQAEEQGLQLDETVRVGYEQASAELAQAEKAVTDAYVQLSRMNDQGVSPADPARQQVVKSITESVKARNKAAQKVSKAYSRVLQSTETLAAEADAEMNRRAEAYQKQDEQLAQYKFERDAQNDPQGMVSALAQQETILQAEMIRLQGELDAAPTGSAQARQLYQTIQQLGTAIAGIQEMKSQAEAYLPTAEPLTIPDETQSGETGTNTPPEAEAPVQGEKTTTEALPAQQLIDQYRADGTTDEQIAQMARGLLDDADSEPSDIELAKEILDRLGQGNRSIAQRYIEANGSRARDSRVTDLLNIARQEASNGDAQASDEAGMEAAREILRGTAQSADPSIAAMKEQLRRLGIVPTAQERANIAATYGSYDAYRRAVAGAVPLGGQNKAGQSIDQAIGELADSFPGQVTGDDRVKWLYDFARNNPAGAIAYDGDLDADARSLWEQIRSENADYFAPAPQQNPGFDVPDFSQPNVKYGKAAASEWLRNTLNAGTEEASVLDYARDKSVTALTGKERAFWDNVQQAAQNKNPTRQAFKPTQEEQAANDTARLFDKTSPYASASTTNMKHERSTRQERRKLASIRRDIQQLLGFSYSDEHFSRTERKAGAAAYYEPKHHFIASDDANNMDAFLHEAGHAARMQQYDADEIAAFKATMPKNFLDAYPEAAQNGEAAAEMFRAWMLNPELMERTYYNTFAQMRETIGNRKYSRLRDQGNSVRKWVDDSTQQRVAAIQRTRAEQEKSENKFVQAVKSFVKSSVDYEYGYRKLDRAMQRNGVTLASSTSARAACARTSSEAINALMYDGMFDPETGERVYCSFTETAKGLIKTEDDVERLNVYLELKQSLDRYEANKKDWGYSKDICTPVEAKAFVETVEAEHRNVAQAAENIWKWLKKYRDTQLSSAISTETLEKWEKLNPHYIPQTRVFTNNIKRAAKGGIGGQNSGVSRRQVGSTRDYLSPMDAIVDMVMRTKTAALKHETLVTLQQYYDEDANGIAGQFLHEVEPGITVETVNGEAVKRAVTEGMENAELDEDAINTVNALLENTNPEAKVYHVGVKDGKTGNVIAITVDGNTRYFEVLDQDLMDAIAPMKKVQLQGIFGVISKCTRFVNSLITSNNPLFAMPNAIRDYVTGYMTGSTQNPFKYAGDYIKAAGNVITNREVYQQYKAMGGGGGLSQSFARASDINDVTSAMFKKAGDNRNLAKRWADGFMDKIEAINGGIEAVPRLAEYKRQLAKGSSFAEAIKAAKEVTTDFSVSGTHSPIYSMLWRFYGANVNSTYKQINNVADAAASGDKGRIARQAAAGASVMALTIALNLINHMHDDETNYDALPDYIKEKYWVFPTKEKGKFIRIPKPNDLMPTEWIMAADHVSNVLVGIEGGDGTGEAIGREAVDYVTDLLQAINPFGEANEGNPVGSNFTLNPLIQVFTNTSWTGAPIVSASLEGLSPELQYNERTSYLARFIGSVVGMSPQKVDYIINQNSGVVGEVKDAINAGVSKGMTNGPVAGGLAFGKELLFSRFLIDSAYSEQVTSAYYDQRELLSTFIGDVDETMDRDGLPYSPQLKGLNPQQTQAAYTQAKALDKQLNDLTKQLSALSQMATRAANEGDEEKAREYRFKRQELAAEGSLHIAEFYDSWQQVK